MDRSLFFHIWQFSLPTLAFFSSVFRNAIHCALYVTMWLIFRLTLLFLSRLSDLFLSFVYSGRRCYYGPELQWHASGLASCQVNTCFACMFWNTVICAADLSQCTQVIPCLVLAVQGEPIKDTSPSPFTSWDVTLNQLLVWSWRPGQQFWATNP
jgi:hypothetical protein